MRKFMIVSEDGEFKSQPIEQLDLELILGFLQVALSMMGDKGEMQIEHLDWVTNTRQELVKQ